MSILYAATSIDVAAFYKLPLNQFFSPSLLNHGI